MRLLVGVDQGDQAARRDWIEHWLGRCAADELLPLLKDESERYLNIDPWVALRLAETLVRAGQLANRPDFHALGLMATGDVYRVLGRFEESVTAMDQAGEQFLAQGDEVGWARTRNGWLRSAHRLGRGAAALIEADRARDILAKHGVWLRAATLDYNSAFVCSEMGKFAEALARYDRAKQTYESIGATAELYMAAMNVNKAVLLRQLGDFRAALQLYAEAKQIYLRHGQTVSMLRQESHIAQVYAAQGYYTRALQHYNAALAGQERMGLDIDVAWGALGMVECYLNLNRNTQALELAEETIGRFERCGTPTEAASARRHFALAHARLGDVPAALRLLDDAEQAFAAAGLGVNLALTILQQATVHRDDGNWLAATEAAKRASGLFAEQGLAIRQAQADLVWSRSVLARGDYALATALAQSSLRVSRADDLPWLALGCQHVLGRIAEARGSQQEALGEYDQAVMSIEQLQGSLAIELRTNFLADKVHIYGDAIDASLRLSQAHLAFTYLERAKSRTLVDYLASNMEVHARGHDGANTELLTALTAAREEHNYYYNQLHTSGIPSSDAPAGRRMDDASLRSGIRERERQIARLMERLGLDHTEGLGLASSVAPVDHTIPRLDGETVLLEYYLRESGSIVFLVTCEGLTAVPLAARPDHTQRLLQQWRMNMAATGHAIASGTSLEGLGRHARGILASLYRALLSPVTDRIAGAKRLIVIPYGITHAVPFHALHDGARYLIEDVEVSVCPSSRLLRLCAERPRRATRSALILAHTNQGRLPAVLAEARTVAELLPGQLFTEEQATRSRLQDATAQHSVIHIAAHGEARLDNPAFAHVQLADGQLSTIDVFNLDLHGALVTLSACETGRGVIAGGDEVIGLSRGFLFAGASTLVQSLWRVEDNSTADFMKYFYEQICASEPKGAALRNAQCRMLSTHGISPYFWAPFQLVGDFGPL